MQIRIDNIRVKRAGPLKKDFELDPGDLNLVYGHNETGKSYIVEVIISLLFRTGTKAPAKWTLRDWERAGKIVVSGLEDAPIPFMKTGKRLEDYWEEPLGLPKDLSRLLVVKAGETMLAGKEEDGVGHQIVKDYLSGEGLLDKIGDRISITLKGATVEDRLIVGPRKGEVKIRIQCKERLDGLNGLLKDVEEGYTSGEVYSFRHKKEAIEAELNQLERAKRYHAAQLHEQIQALSRKKDELPSEEELSELQADVRIHDSRKTEVETKSATLKKLEGTSEDYRWTEKALADYDILSKRALYGPKPIWILFALLFFMGMVVTGFLGLNVPLVVCSIGALAFFILYYMATRNALARAGESRELEKLKADFRSRFGSALTSRAVLQVQLEKLKENDIRATSLREEVDKLTLEIDSRKSNITETLKAFTGTEGSPQQWRDLIRERRNSIKELEDEIRSLENELASLAVPEEKYLKKDPGVEWNPARYDTLKQELPEIKEALGGEMTRLDRLKARTIQETHSKSTEWEALITELRAKREEVAGEYRDITAEILAKIQVNSAIEEFRKEENARIDDGLKRQELTEPLQALTDGTYARIKQEEDRGLVLITCEDDEYHLAHVSTGAREQVFLALRIGFASIAMGGLTAFLILDDAFQHSDWNRRKTLVAEIVNLVKSGWQIFYFAMDDHIRDLIFEAGKVLGDRFRSMELC